MSHGGGGFFASLIREERPAWWIALVVIILIFLIVFLVAFLPIDTTDPGEILQKVIHALGAAWFKGWGSLFITIDIILVGLAIWAIIGVWPIKIHLSVFEKPTQLSHASHAKVAHAPKDPQVARAWIAILTRAKTGTQENMRLAVMEADVLIDQVLKRAKYEGDHMADRLSLIDPDKIKSLDRVWEAHRLRNQLVHTPGISLGADEVKDALTAYRDFLVEFGVL